MHPVSSKTLISNARLFVIGVLIFCGLIVACDGKSRESKKPNDRRSATVSPGPTQSSVMPATPAPQVLNRHTAPETSGPLFVVRNDGIHLPAFDDRPASAPPELVRYDYRLFLPPVNLFRERAIITRPEARTTTFTLPARCQEIGFLMRSTSVEEEWPFVTVTLVEAARPSHRAPLFSGVVANRELRYFWWKVPEGWQDKLCWLEVNITNPRYDFGQTSLVVANVIFR
ncbi:MAG: hypothetical protein KatS3mg130_0748 [Candidatus Sumerlaea sp.]|nr:MAG: hypothetical protein KatS3mg130_0748 [Candidatus Sumerlaea sp.]